MKKHTMGNFISTINENVKHYFGDMGIELYSNDHIDIVNTIKFIEYFSFKGDIDKSWSKVKDINGEFLSLLDVVKTAIQEEFKKEKSYKNFITILYDLLLIRYDLGNFILLKTIIKKQNEWHDCLIKKIALALQSYGILDNDEIEEKIEMGDISGIQYDQHHNVNETSRNNILKYLSKNQPYDNASMKDAYVTFNNICDGNNIVKLNNFTQHSLYDFYKFYQGSLAGHNFEIDVYSIRFSPLYPCLAFKAFLPSWYLLVPRGYLKKISKATSNIAIKNFMDKQTNSYVNLYKELDFQEFQVKQVNPPLQISYFDHCVEKFIQMKKFLSNLETPADKDAALSFFADEYNLIREYDKLDCHIMNKKRNLRTMLLQKYFISFPLLFLSCFYIVKNQNFSTICLCYFAHKKNHR